MSDTPNQVAKKRGLFWRAASLVIVIITLSIVTLLYGYRIYDYFAAQAFTPSAEVGAIHDSLRLTDQASNILYASQPKLQSGEDFNQSCKSTERTAAILGCYHLSRIYVYNITNAELVGANEVTTAHEMLHAAYERLNVFERTHVDQMVNDEYQRVKYDSKINQLMDYYKKTEPTELTNELHSILGTVITDLSPQLEQYYARYFTDRQHVVQVNNSYYAVFAEVEARSTVLSDKITVLSKEVAADKLNYDQSSSRLKLEVDQFKTRTAVGYYTSNSVMQADMRALNARVDALERERIAVNSKIEKLNELIRQLNELSIRANQLNGSINGIETNGVSL